MARQAFLSGLHCFSLLPTGFGKNSVKHCGAQRWRATNLIDPLELCQITLQNLPLIYRHFLRALYQSDTWNKSERLRKHSIWHGRCCQRILESFNTVFLLSYFSSLYKFFSCSLSAQHSAPSGGKVCVSSGVKGAVLSQRTVSEMERLFEPHLRLLGWEESAISVGFL